MAFIVQHSYTPGSKHGPLSRVCVPVSTQLTEVTLLLIVKVKNIEAVVAPGNNSVRGVSPMKLMPSSPEIGAASKNYYYEWKFCQKVRK